MSAFNIKTSAFEGPLELLLSLVEKRKLFINDIALAQVTDDFIKHIEDRGTMPIEESSHFILIASTLLLIKSKSLLPNLTLTEEEEEGIQDLEIRLKIYQRIKSASVDIKANFYKERIFRPLVSKKIIPVFSPHKSINRDSVSKSISDIINSFPKKDLIPKAVVRKVISLEEMVESLSKRVTQGLKMKFSDFSSSHKEKVNIIVGFLAMLELVKQGIINVAQEEDFGDIHMETKDVGVPRYN